MAEIQRPTSSPGRLVRDWLAALFNRGTAQPAPIGDVLLFANGKLISPSSHDAHHFTNGDAALFGYGSDGHPVVVEDATPTPAREVVISGYLGSAERQLVSVSSLVHAGGCDLCDSFTVQWEAEQNDKETAYRNEFSPAARARADHLCDAGLDFVSSDGTVCGHFDRYVLSPDAPVPHWFRAAMNRAALTAPEGPWPNWGRTCHAIDWATLVALHPDEIAPEQNMLDWNLGGTWDSIAAALRVALAADPNTETDVNFWVDEQGRITVEPMGIYCSFDLPAAVAAQIDELLIAGGRDPRLLHDDDNETPYAPARRGWLVEC